MAAVALLGPTATTPVVSSLLGGTTASFAPVRDRLLKAGDLVSTGHGRIAVASPVFGECVLMHYPDAATAAAVELTALDEMHHASPAGPRSCRDRIRPGSTDASPWWLKLAMKGASRQRRDKSRRVGPILPCRARSAACRRDLSLPVRAMPARADASP